MAFNLEDLLNTQIHKQIHREYSGLEVYFLPELSAYLKIGIISKNSNLRWERDVLEWLSGKIQVPNVLDFEISDGREYSLISEIRGQTYSEELAASDKSSEIENFIELVAARIREIHDLAIDDCDLDQRLMAKIKKADENIRNGFVLESDFDQENLGKTARQVFDELMCLDPPDEDLVFTHGDLCLPNIILDKTDVAGFIDFGKGGVADRYQDIALFLRSFHYNSSFVLDITSAFCRGYGIEDLDWDKIDFYRKLDELF